MWNVETPSGSDRARLERGRQADREESPIPGREQDAQEANAGGRKAAGKRQQHVCTRSSSRGCRITGRIPGRVPGRESGLT